MQLSVALCTWNRSALLDQTLDRMADLRVPPDVSWRLVVVDNGSTDDTPRVLARHAARLPLDHVVEPRLGHSHARNTAVAASSGSHIVWTDDDVLTDPDWLLAYVDAFRAHPDAVVFGGRVLPWFEGTPPAWIAAALPHHSRLQSAYALRDLGPEPFVFGAGDSPRFPYGANMAMRLDVLREHPFDTRLGRKGHGEVRGEEVAVIRGLLADGRYGVWVPASVVQHVIPRDRQSSRFIRRYYAGQAEQDAMQQTEPLPGRHLFGVPLWLWRQALQAEVQAVRTHLRGDPLARVDATVTVGRHRGGIRARLRGLAATAPATVPVTPPAPPPPPTTPDDGSG